jgi:uncharacterized protein
MSRVNYFEISAINASRFIEFYQSIFGWTIKKWDMPGMDYWTISTGPEKEPGIDGGLSVRQKDNYVINSIGVDDLDSIVAQIRKKGGKIVSDKMSIPGVGYYAVFEDTEGNTLSLMQNDPKAK